MAAVIIGVDPHKGSRTAVAIDGSEKRLGRLRVPAAGDQAGTLLEQSASWPDRTWAVEGAGGLGHLLDWQLVAAGEKVLDIQPKLGSRVRLLSSGSANKNDPNDAFSVAVAALRSPVRRVVRPEDHTTALKLQCKRYQDLSRLRNQAACRLHALLCGLVPGGIATEITTAQATEVPRNRPPGQPRRPSAAPARHRPRRRHAPPGPAAPRHPRRARRRGQGLGHQSWPASTASARSSPPSSSATWRTSPGSPPGTASPHTTAPRRPGVSSGQRVVHRLSQRGNRRLNHATPHGRRDPRSATPLSHYL